MLAARSESLSADLTAAVTQDLAADQDGTRLVEHWGEMGRAEQTWLAAADPQAMIDSLASDEGLLTQVWGNQVLALLSRSVTVPMHRQLVRTGNFELTGEHFNWVSDFEVAPGDETCPIGRCCWNGSRGGGSTGRPSNWS